MIEFCGEISDDCKKYLVKELVGFNFIIAPLMSILLSVPIVFLGIFKSVWILFFLIIPVLLGIMIAIPKTNPQLKTVNLNAPTKITITSTKIEREGSSEINYACRDITKIKKVVDAGKWYHLIFYFGYKDIFFICQKNLISKGSIDDFEKLFEGKIVRKVMRNWN